MTEEKTTDVDESWEESHSILILLEHLAQSEPEDFRKVKESVEKGQEHPSGESLHDYVMGWLDDESTMGIMQHIALCGTCLDKVFVLRRAEHDLAKTVLKLADQPPWKERIRTISSGLLFPYDTTPILEPLSKPVPGSLPHTHVVGEQTRLRIRMPEDGHLVVFHFDPDNQLDLLFPDGQETETYLHRGQEQIIRYSIKGPQGKHVFKVLWTRHQLLNPERIKFGDAFSLEVGLVRFTQALERSSEPDWFSMVCEYEIVQPKQTEGE